MNPLRRQIERAVAHLFLALALLASGACIEFEQLIKVKPDGSGELIQKIKISEKLFEEMAASGQEVTQEEIAQGFEEMKTQFQAAPESLGEGVRFLDVEPIPAEAGSSLPMAGYQFRFAFDDIRTLDFSAFPDIGPQGPGPAPDAAGDQASSEEASGDDDRVRFRFEKKGKRSVLSAVFFESQEAMEKEMAELQPDSTTDETGMEGMDEMAEAMFEMVEEMLGGFRLAVVVEVMGTLTDTNASTVDGNRVTLVELDFDRLLEQKEKLERLADIEGQPTLSQIGLLLQEVDGVTFPLTPEVTIEFR